jgi:hypothetical protein
MKGQRLLNNLNKAASSRVDYLENLKFGWNRASLALILFEPEFLFPTRFLPVIDQHQPMDSLIFENQSLEKQ